MSKDTKTLQSIHDLIPPQDLEAERSLLGSIMLDSSVLDGVLAHIGRGDGDWFYLPAHRTLWSTLVDMWGKSMPVDIITLGDELERRGKHDDVGGLSYLITLAESVPSAANAAYYARIVATKGRLRDLISLGHRIIRDAHANGADPEELLAGTDMAMLRLRGIVGKQTSVSIADVARTIQDDIAAGRVRRGLATGLHFLDCEKLGGLYPGEMTILAARPSLGKTALALQILVNVTLHQGLPAAMFSLEMSAESLSKRCLSALTGVSGRRQDDPGGLSDVERAAIAACQLPSTLIIADTGNLDATTFRSRARTLVGKHGVKLIVVDYLGLMSDPAEKFSKVVATGNVSRAIKLTARELNVPVLALHQLNRDSAREGRRPELNDLRDSGAVEQDADVVLFLWQDKKPDHARSAEYGVQLYVAKNRNGPIGNRKYIFHSASMTFSEECPPAQERWSAPPPSVTRAADKSTEYEAPPLQDVGNFCNERWD